MNISLGTTAKTTLILAFFVFSANITWQHYSYAVDGVIVRSQGGDAPRYEELKELDIQAGWISLFDGATLFGWRNENGGNWRIEDQAIVVDQAEKVGLLRTSAQFDDFELSLDFRAPSTTNSGVFLRTSPEPKDPNKDCYEFNIAEGEIQPFPTGSLVGRAKSDARFDSDIWHRLKVESLGGQISIWIDGVPTVTYKDEIPLGRGYIGLQFNSGRVEFTNIWIRPLNLDPLFNGKDLDGWKTAQAMDGKFSVTSDGTVHVENGRGQLESEIELADFYLQLACRTNAPRLNSGLFFRCIPGELMNGYESQIHNGFLNNDRSQPEDHGTGGIFRRQSARKVVANDEVWFYKTIIADGPHFCVWVNGFQVSDWTDSRPAKKNPREGYRKEAGTLILQAHDPTTNIDFKAIRAREMKVRRAKK
jgi:Domain of Unknown Function (DUF1080)